jgi:gluconolactonase
MHFDLFCDGVLYAEGPVALDDGSVICVAVTTGRLVRAFADGSLELVAEPGGGPNGAAIGPDGRCYLCNNGGLTAADLAKLAVGDDSNSTPPGGRIETVDLHSGEVELLYDSCDGVPLLSPNDLVFDTLGGFFFSDYGSAKRASPQPGRVYHALADGSAIRPFGRVFERPNGVGLSPDGKVLYVSETSSGCLWRVWVDDPDRSQILYQDPELVMDSLAVQADGKICVACPVNQLILRVSPEGRGEMIPTPQGHPSNICFGGADLQRAYVTLIHEGILLTAQWDSPGLPLACAHPSLARTGRRV